MPLEQHFTNQILPEQEQEVLSTSKLILEEGKEQPHNFKVCYRITTLLKGVGSFCFILTWHFFLILNTLGIAC